MSHTTIIGEYTFLHNGDYSGEVHVVGPKKADNGERTTELVVPIGAIEQFVAGKQRDRLVAHLDTLDLSKRYNRMKIEDLIREAGI